MKLLELFILLLPVSLQAQSGSNELIPWNESRKLTWADYKGRPDTNSDAAASTATYIGIEYSMRNNNFSFRITCSFSKTRSWGLHKTDYILAHEQGHFDIAEIFARKLNKEMSLYVFNSRSYQKDLKKIYDDVMLEKEKMQNQYDAETNHSIIKDKQEEWLKKIAGLLNEYKTYSGY